MGGCWQRKQEEIIQELEELRPGGVATRMRESEGLHRSLSGVRFRGSQCTWFWDKPPKGTGAMTHVSIVSKEDQRGSEESHEGMCKSLGHVEHEVPWAHPGRKLA